MTLIGLLVFVLIVALILWVVQMMPLDGRIRLIVQAVVAVVVLLYLLEMLGVLAMGPVIRLR